MCTCVDDVASFVVALRWRELPRVGEGDPLYADLMLCVPVWCILPSSYLCPQQPSLLFCNTSIGVLCQLTIHFLH